MNLLKLWLTPKEAAVVLGTTADSITRDIREKQFPFKFERQGRRIKICARSIGLIPEAEAGRNEARNQEESLATAA